MVVGAGPTGVEMAGQIAEIARDTRRDFRAIDTSTTRVLLVEAGDRVLAAFPPKLSRRRAKALESLGVTPLVDHTGHRHRRRRRDDGDRRRERVRAGTVIWAAGVLASGLSGALAEASGAETDSVGRLLVEPDLTLPGHPEVLAIGDMVQVRGARPAARASRRWRCRWGATRRKLRPRRLRARTRPARSSTRTRATWRRSGGRGRWPSCRRGSASAASSPGRCGSAIHLFYLSASRTGCWCFIRWGFSFLTHGRGTRLITGEQNMP